MKTTYNMPKNAVPSGSYIISGQKEEIVEAYLGTCVGVTICDPVAGIGGLIHLLLPEPTGIDGGRQPGNYATTGLPLFIRGLYAAGAHGERMKAYVAGGALVGPVSERDLALDIGGRTTEIVEDLLHCEGISVTRSETGGFFACRLGLNLLTWESVVEPLGVSGLISTGMDIKKPTPAGLQNAMESVIPIPQTALKIIRMIRDDTQGMKDMAREIRRDQVISAKVIRLCNSAFFGVKVPIDSIDRALVILGEKRLLQLVVSASMEDFFPDTEQGYSLCKGGLYNHALGTAMICEKLAGLTGKVSPDIAYTAGLLHDIGKVVLDQYMAPAYPLFYRRTQLNGENLISVENEVFGITHPEAGYRLAERWSLPESLIDTILFHHRPEKATANPELTHLVYLADLVMSRFIVGQELERVNTDDLKLRLGKLGLGPEQFPMVIDSIPHQLLNTCR